VNTHTHTHTYTELHLFSATCDKLYKFINWVVVSEEGRFTVGLILIDEVAVVKKLMECKENR